MGLCPKPCKPLKRLDLNSIKMQLHCIFRIKIFPLIRHSLLCATFSTGEKALNPFRQTCGLPPFFQERLINDKFIFALIYFSCTPRSYFFIYAAITFIIFSESIGFEIWSFIPACHRQKRLPSWLLSVQFLRHLCSLPLFSLPPQDRP